MNNTEQSNLWSKWYDQLKKKLGYIKDYERTHIWQMIGHEWDFDKIVRIIKKQRGQRT